MSGHFEGRRYFIDDDDQRAILKRLGQGAMVLVFCLALAAMALGAAGCLEGRF